MRRMLAVLLTIAFSRGLASPFVALQDPRYGPSSITFDAITNLDWLDLTITLNKSYNYVTSQFGTGGEFEGFRVAQRSDMDQLFDTAGIKSPRYFPDAANLQPVSIFQRARCTSPR